MVRSFFEQFATFELRPNLGVISMYERDTFLLYSNRPQGAGRHAIQSVASR